MNSFLHMLSFLHYKVIYAENMTFDMTNICMFTMWSDSNEGFFFTEDLMNHDSITDFAVEFFRLSSYMKMLKIEVIFLSNNLGPSSVDFIFFFTT